MTEWFNVIQTNCERIMFNLLGQGAPKSERQTQKDQVTPEKVRYLNMTSYFTLSKTIPWCHVHESWYLHKNDVKIGIFFDFFISNFEFWQIELRKLMELPGNDKCADCGAAGQSTSWVFPEIPHPFSMTFPRNFTVLFAENSRPGMGLYKSRNFHLYNLLWCAQKFRRTYHKSEIYIFRWLGSRTYRRYGRGESTTL